MPDRISQPRLKLQDRLMANALSAGSAVANILPEKLNFTVNNTAPSSTPVRWQHLGKPAEGIRADWVKHEGDETAGLLPRNFNLAAIILIDREEMDNRLSVNGSKPAVAYKLGSAVMLGHSSEYQILGLENPDDEDYRVAMGIGKGPLEAGAGVVFRGGNSYYAGMMYDPLVKGVRQGSIVPIPEVPPSIPYL